ncbi:MAG: hypothetical protein ACK43N_02315, partial [Pirellulaceae bacterium]
GRHNRTNVKHGRSLINQVWRWFLQHAKPLAAITVKGSRFLFRVQQNPPLQVAFRAPLGSLL